MYSLKKKLSVWEKARKSPTFWDADLVRKSRAFLVLVKFKNKKLSLQKKPRKSPTFWDADLVRKSWAFVYKHTIEMGEKES